MAIEEKTEQNEIIEEPKIKKKKTFYDWIWNIN